jgi:AcrR family transcriptional regulator
MSSVMSTGDRFPRRAAQARATRRRVVEAATDLFVSRGYTATSIASIASQAGVAVQTVYAAFGNKPSILAAAVDQAITGDDLPIAANDRDWMQVVLESQDPAVRLRAYARAVGRIHAGAAAVFRALDVAASGEPELSALWQETLRRRRVGVTGVVRPIADAGALLPGLTFDEAIDVVWSLNGHEIYLNLVEQSGWQRERYEEWLGDALVALVLNSSDAPD